MQPVIVEKPAGLLDIIWWLFTTMTSTMAVVLFTGALIAAMLWMGLWAIGHSRKLMLRIELAWSEPREKLLQKVMKERKVAKTVFDRLFRIEDYKKEQARIKAEAEDKKLKEKKEESALILPASMEDKK